MPVCHFVLRQKSASNVTGNSAVWTQSRQRGLRKVVWSARGGAGGCMKHVSPTFFLSFSFSFFFDYALSLARLPQTLRRLKRELFLFGFWKRLGAFCFPQSTSCSCKQRTMEYRKCQSDQRVYQFEMPRRASVWALLKSVSSKCFLKTTVSLFFSLRFVVCEELCNVLVSSFVFFLSALNLSWVTGDRFIWSKFRCLQILVCFGFRNGRRCKVTRQFLRRQLNGENKKIKKKKEFSPLVRCRLANSSIIIK